MVLLDNAPDLTQNVISLSLAELIKTESPKGGDPGRKHGRRRESQGGCTGTGKGAKENNHC